MIKEYYKLIKPGIVFGNAVTGASGFILASKEEIDFFLFALTLFGLSLIVASGCVLNNYLDRLADRQMARTRSRPLAKGTISPQKALFFGFTLLLFGLFVLGFFTNLLTTCLAAFGFLIYVGFYSIWKYLTVYGTEIGSIAGAIPPVVGYSAVSNRLDLGAGLLFLIVALWQMPHFFAIAIYRMEEYASASIPVSSLQRGIPKTKIRILFYMAAFILSVLLLSVFHYASYVYLTIALALSGYWLKICFQGFKAENDRRWARRVFLSSLVVILGLCFSLALDRLYTGARQIQNETADYEKSRQEFPRF